MWLISSIALVVASVLCALDCADFGALMVDCVLTSMDTSFSNVRKMQIFTEWIDNHQYKCCLYSMFCHILLCGKLIFFKSFFQNPLRGWRPILWIQSFLRHLLRIRICLILVKSLTNVFQIYIKPSSNLRTSFLSKWQLL